MSIDFETFYGNSQIVEYFSERIRNNSISHAYIFHGKSGIGKKYLAKLISAALSCTEKSTSNSIPCGKCENCKKILSDNSIDLKIFDKNDKATIGIDLIRQIKDDIVTVPNDTEYKIYIIDDADAMTVQAQNAFLLTLEEPPKYAIFFLIAENMENILETIKSRAQIIRFAQPTLDEIKSFLSTNYPKEIESFSKDDLDMFIKEYEYSIGSIVKSIQSKENDIESENLPRLIITSLSNSEFSKKYFDILSSFSKYREKIIYQISMIEKAFRDVLIIKKSDSKNLLFFAKLDEVEDFSLELSQTKLFCAINSCELAKQKILQGSNITLTLNDFLSSLL